MQRWEYLLGYLDKGRALWVDTTGCKEPLSRDQPYGIALGPTFTRLGDEGWELVGVDSDQYVFKRPKQ